ncbi:hypothetical protein D4764_21G0000510 [Takifugu flavidus]|uniref:Fork-head domain-containing protein n=1 Tax=Takifugu flavidus TaxID=433684 RepID=A0A5C6NF02_9TELE|nr:hypothetical protein D4764_21G0000510 [Takifugu flavidus]
METFGTLCAPVGSSQQRLFRKSSTYLAKIAVVLQCAPEKMLTFPQLMDHLMPIMSENRRSFENNIRVCLSTNKCFVKIPVVPDSLDSKRKYWKLDSSQITAKMARRHFKGILQLFPELASKVEAENRSRTLGGQGSLKAPEAAAAAARRVQNRREERRSDRSSSLALVHTGASAGTLESLSSFTGHLVMPPSAQQGAAHTKDLLRVNYLSNFFTPPLHPFSQLPSPIPVPLHPGSATGIHQLQPPPTLSPLPQHCLAPTPAQPPLLFSQLTSLWHSHLVKIFEQLFVSLLRPQVEHDENTLQFADDTILYLPQQAHLCLDNTSECK